MRSIQEKAHEIKLFARNALAAGLGEWGVAAVVVLVGLISFGLGRLSVLEETRPLVSVGQAPITTKPRAMALGGQLVASRTGTVYYFPWCGGAQQIPAGSQVWFNSENTAQKAGYRPAKNCRGLESNK